MLVRRVVLLLSLGCVCFAGSSHAQWASNGNGVCVWAADQSYPATASDGAGGAFVVWIDRRWSTEDLYLQRITSTGAIAAGWAANGVVVCTQPNSQREPVIVPDGAGGVYVAWEDWRGATGPDIYLQRMTGAGAVATGWPAQGLAICSLAGAQSTPSLALESGTAVVAWEDNRNGASKVYVQKTSAAGATLWTGGGLQACTGAGAQVGPSIVGDGSGGAIVSWQDARSGTEDIYAQRIDAAGLVAWTAGGVSLCGASNDQLTPHAIPDGAGGAVVTWDDYRDNNSDLYAQRVNASGVPQWTAGGKALCTDLGEQYGGLPISDGAGGVILPWTDFRSGLVKVYAQRITAAGAVSWAANGVAISTVGDISDPVAAPDGAGGAFFVWADVRPGSLGVDLYAARYTSAGAPAAGWTAGGGVICNATNDQLRPVATLDGSGTTIVSWFDARNVNYDIYSKRLVGSGTVDVPEAPAAALDLALAPNPMRGDPVSLRFRLPVAETVRVELLDVAGRVIRVLAEGREMPAGFHELSWDGRDRSGATAPGGLYFVRLAVADRVEMHKLARVR